MSNITIRPPASPTFSSNSTPPPLEVQPYTPPDISQAPVTSEEEKMGQPSSNQQKRKLGKCTATTPAQSKIQKKHDPRENYDCLELQSLEQSMQENFAEKKPFLIHTVFSGKTINKTEKLYSHPHNSALTAKLINAKVTTDPLSNCTMVKDECWLYCPDPSISQGFSAESIVGDAYVLMAYAAHNGAPSAIEYLSIMYHVGEGVPQHLTKSEILLQWSRSNLEKQEVNNQKRYQYLELASAYSKLFSHSKISAYLDQYINNSTT